MLILINLFSYLENEIIYKYPKLMHKFSNVTKEQTNKRNVIGI